MLPLRGYWYLLLAPFGVGIYLVGPSLPSINHTVTTTQPAIASLEEFRESSELTAPVQPTVAAYPPWVASRLPAPAPVLHVPVVAIAIDGEATTESASSAGVESDVRVWSRQTPSNVRATFTQRQKTPPAESAPRSMKISTWHLKVFEAH